MSRRSLLERIESAPPTDVIAVIEDELVAAVGAHGVSFLIADYLGRAVVRFDRWTWSVPDGREPVVEHSETVPLPGTVYERVMQTQRVDMRDTDSGVVAVVPVTVTGDALGALELRLPARPDEQALLLIEAVAHALAYIVVVNRRYTDLFERGQRTAPMSLAAEIQRRLDEYAGRAGRWQVSVADGVATVFGAFQDDAEHRVVKILAATVAGVTTVHLNPSAGTPPPGEDVSM